MTAHHITVEPFAGRVRASVAGEVVADSERALVLHEGGLPDRYYLPPEDVRAEALRPSDTTSHCPFKGDASYHSIVAGGEEHPDLVWYYPEPLPAVAEIRDHLAFYEEKLDLAVEPA